METVHYLKPGTDRTPACGRDIVRPELSEEVQRVDCGLCERTEAYKAAYPVYLEKLRASEEAKAERNAEIAAAGFDPDKPLAKWSKDEVEAYVAWREGKETHAS